MFTFTLEIPIIIITIVGAIISLAVSEFDTNECIVMGLSSIILGIIILVAALVINFTSPDTSHIMAVVSLTMVVAGAFIAIIGMGFDLYRMEAGVH